MTERTYDLSIDFKHFDVDLVNSNDLDGYCSMFSSFSLGLIRDFQEYADDPDAVRRPRSYRGRSPNLWSLICPAHRPNRASTPWRSY